MLWNGKLQTIDPLSFSAPFINFMSHLFEMVTKLGLNSRSQPCWKHGGSGPGTVMNESRSYSPSAAAGPGVFPPLLNRDNRLP